MRVNWRRISGANNTLAVLHAACESHGYHLEIADAPRMDVTCYSLNSLNEPRYREEIRRAPCITIVGGPHASACPGEVAEYADYVVVGEGERTLPALLEWLEGIRHRLPAGVATRDSYRPPDSCVRLDAYPPFSHFKGYIEISRGCPHHCAYCQTPRLFGSGMRHRSIDRIAEYARRYRDIRFVSPNALAYGSDGISPSLGRVEALLKALSGNVFFGTFPNEVRPEFISDGALELVQQYCANDRIHFGAQSGSDRVLRALSRGHTTEDVIRAAELCREHGFEPVVDFIIGLPMESDEDQRATLDLINWIARFGRVRVHRFLPLPGTPLAGEAAREVLPELRSAFGRLALRGRLTGSWGAPSVKVF